MLAVADKTMRKLYAIRGGQGHGAYGKFHEAIGAGWYQKQPYGNAAYFSQEEQEEAHAWIDGRTPFPEGHLTALACKVKEQHIFVRIVFLTIFTTVMAMTITWAAYSLHEKLDCQNFPGSGSAPCIWSLKLIAFVNEHQNQFLELAGAEIFALVGISYTQAAGYF
jgi:hypothetical protein